MLDGGRGSDTIYARDGKPDWIEGGKGYDDALVDATDTLIGIEKLLKKK